MRETGHRHLRPPVEKHQPVHRPVVRLRSDGLRQCQGKLPDFSRQDDNDSSELRRSGSSKGPKKNGWPCSDTSDEMRRYLRDFPIGSRC
jgi:hypothetical protein